MMLAMVPLNVDTLPDDCVVLKELLVTLHAQHSATVEAMHLQILKLYHAQFGASSERLSAQSELFAEILNVRLSHVVKQKVFYEHHRKGRPALPKDLPRQRIEHHLDAQQVAQFGSVKPIGEELSETLQYIPACLLVLEHVRIKYAVASARIGSSVITSSSDQAT